VRQFDKRKDGRAAVLALKAQAEGESVKIMRKAAAYASIASAVFNGNRRGYTFANYVTVHQEAHNELFDLEEPVAESKKVTDFLTSIKDPSLAMGKTVLMSDSTRLEDFKACQQYLSTLIQTMQTQAKAERHVNGVDTKGRGGGGSLVDRLKSGPYTDEQYASLTPKEKERVKKYRSTMQRKTNKRTKANKRKLAKAKTDRKDSAEAKVEKDNRTDSNAGSQFGANGNRNKRQKT
jgi:hypothetical protein